NDPITGHGTSLETLPTPTMHCLSPYVALTLGHATAASRVEPTGSCTASSLQ
ncbi:hypothetical protein NQZ68_032080, partial [Dissostichus eleginoides]